MWPTLMRREQPERLKSTPGCILHFFYHHAFKWHDGATRALSYVSRLICVIFPALCPCCGNSNYCSVTSLRIQEVRKSDVFSSKYRSAALDSGPAGFRAGVDKIIVSFFLFLISESGVSHAYARHETSESFLLYIVWLDTTASNQVNRKM